MFLKTGNVENQRIYNVVDNDFRYAKVLDSFGVNFYKCGDLTINEICKIKGIKKESLLGYRISLDESFDLDFGTLENSPLNLVIEYLKHNHSYFIKNKLPYIKDLISNLDIEDKSYPFFEDLKFIFPFFYEDFVDHILEEEKFIFTHIQNLSSSRVKGSDHAKLFFALKNISLKEIADEHMNEDSEMSGIRGLTKNYSLDNIDNLHLKVIFQELKDFDNELEIHSDIENKILFPRALELENLISDKIRNISFLN
jgi:regulator of cell morphogenesis and NO signaling